MNTRRFAFFALAATWGSLSAPSQAQTPASNPPGSYQPLSPTAARVTLLNGKTVRGNVVGEYTTKNGTYYIVDTRKGRTVVDEWALLGVPSLPIHPDEHRHSLPDLPNIHTFH